MSCMLELFVSCVVSKEKVVCYDVLCSVNQNFISEVPLVFAVRITDEFHLELQGQKLKIFKV